MNALPRERPADSAQDTVREPGGIVQESRDMARESECSIQGSGDRRAPAAAYTIAVRALCEFGARRGDLDLRFTPAPSAREGIAGHAWVRSQRGEGYQTEVALSGGFLHLRVRGRAGGSVAVRRRLTTFVPSPTKAVTRRSAAAPSSGWATVPVSSTTPFIVVAVICASGIASFSIWPIESKLLPTRIVAA